MPTPLSAGYRPGTTERESVLPVHHAAFLHRLHVDAAPHITAGLRAFLDDASVSVHAFTEMTFANAPCGRAPLAFAAAEGPAGYLSCSPALLTLILDQLLGCDGLPATADDGMSELTRQFVQETLATLLPAYAQTWAPQQAMTFTPAAAPEPPAPDTPVFVAEYTVITPYGTGALYLLLPLPSWQAALAACAPAPPSPKRSLPLGSPLLQAIGNCLLPVRAVLGHTRVSVQDLLSLQAGDIICLDQAADAPLEIRIGSRPKLRGTARIEEGRYRIMVTPEPMTGGTHGSE
jgi:flagellar motor switch protein FliM